MRLFLSLAAAALLASSCEAQLCNRIRTVIRQRGPADSWQQQQSFTWPAFSLSQPSFTPPVFSLPTQPSFTLPGGSWQWGGGSGETTAIKQALVTLLVREIEERARERFEQPTAQPISFPTFPSIPSVPAPPAETETDRLLKQAILALVSKALIDQPVAVDPMAP